MKSRLGITFYLNGQKQTVTGDQTLATVSDFLRYKKCLIGTKVVCAEGDCGACTALLAQSQEADASEKVRFKAINTCIFPVLGLDGAHLVTIEGVADGEKLHPIQESMIKCHGSQCGFCTPGFICAMTAMTEDALIRKKTASPPVLTAKKVKNSLTGNLCRCTGYQPIIDAALDTDLTAITTLRDRYTSRAQTIELKKLTKVPTQIEWASGKVYLPTTIKQATLLKAKHPSLKIIAGATDLGVQVNKGRSTYSEVMSLQNISALWNIKQSKTKISIGARVSLAKLQRHFEAHDPELDRILNLFASPQIKNTGTLVGNAVNGSPIGDMIPYLLASDAEVVAASKNATRRIPMAKFYLGYKKLALKPNEIVIAIEIPRRSDRDLLRLFKVSLRKDLDISAVTLALRIRHEARSKKVETARIVFGGVGPTVKRLDYFEKKWAGQDFNRKLMADLAAELSDEGQAHINPISDVRGSRDYRLKLCQNLVVRAAHEIFDGEPT